MHKIRLNTGDKRIVDFDNLSQENIKSMEFDCTFARKLRTYEDFLKAVKINGYAIKYVPKEMLTEELMMAAVQQDGWALQYIKGYSYEVALAAVRNNYSVFHFIKDKNIRHKIQPLISELNYNPVTGIHL